MINLRDIEQKSFKDMKFSHVYISKLETAFFLFQFPRECISPSEVLQYRDQFYRRILSTDRANEPPKKSRWPVFHMKKKITKSSEIPPYLIKYRRSR